MYPLKWIYMYNCIYIYTVYCLHQLQNFVAECLYKYHLQKFFLSTTIIFSYTCFRATIRINFVQ